MKAILLAAGQGSRLRPYTDHQPKCLVTLAGHTLLDYQLAVLRQAGIHDITLVTGYCCDQLRSYAVRQIINEAYDRTNMVYSLMCAAELLDGSDDVIIGYTDIVYEPRVLAALMLDSQDYSTIVDLDWLSLWSERLVSPLDDAETLKRYADGRIFEIGKKPTGLAEIEGQYIGLTKLSRRSAPRFRDIYLQMNRSEIYQGRCFNQLYMTDFLQYCIDHTDLDLYGVPIQRGWLEIDTTDDLDSYHQMSRLDTLKAFCDLATISTEKATAQLQE